MPSRKRNDDADVSRLNETVEQALYYIDCESMLACLCLLLLDAIRAKRGIDDTEGQEKKGESVVDAAAVVEKFRSIFPSFRRLVSLRTMAAARTLRVQDFLCS